MSVNRFQGLSLLLGGVGMLGGCARPIELRLTSGGPGLVAGAPIALLQAEEDGPVMHPAVRAALEKSLAAHGHLLKDDAPLVLDVAQSERSGAIGVTSSEKSRSSPPQKKRALGACQKRIHRLTLSVAERSTGTILYQGQAEEVHCKAKPDDSLPYMTEAMAEDLEKPVGQKLIKRNGVR